MSQYIMRYKNYMWAVVLTVVFTIGLGLYFYNDINKDYKLTYNEFISKLDNNEVSEVVLSNSQYISVKLNDNDEITYKIPNPRSDTFKQELLLKGCNVIESDNSTGSLIQSLFSLLIFSVIAMFGIKMLNKQKSGDAMALNAKDAYALSSTAIRFADIAGNIEAKEGVADIVDFIKDPEKYSKYGAHMPHGVIFYGPPGTGKTLMAKAIANEAEVPFFAVSGSDFVQMYVGVGAGRVRELFTKARRSSKAVIFIDEIDALGKKRSNGISGGNDERDQTLNALLTEMSGFNDKDGIIVIAATNRLDTLDEALLRPGRFDRQVEIALPDVSSREKILLHHAKNKPISEDVDFKNLAKQTIFFSGAMLENLLNEAAILAAKRAAETIDTATIDKAYYTIVAGSEKSDKTGVKQQEREITAYHEAGHALVTKLAAPENTVSKVTIIPSTKGAGGFCVNIPPDKMYYTKKEMEAQIMISFAGRASEEIFFGKESITTGASNDIEKATGIIKDYISKYGMNAKLGLLNLDIIKGQNSPEGEFIEECKILSQQLYHKTKEIVNQNKDNLAAIANMLLQRETIHEEDLDFIKAII